MRSPRAPSGGRWRPSSRGRRTPNQVLRENASRRIDVTCNVRGDLGQVAREIEGRVLQLPFAREYHPEFLGEYAARSEASQRLLGFSLLTVLGILLVLYVDFRSLGLTALLLVSLLFALVGGVAGAFVSGGVLSLGSLIGFVTVLGIAARNGIMLVSHYRHLEEKEGMAFGPDLVLLPIALGGSRPGQEIEHPMAIVIIGGLATSTVLNLFLLPPLYLALRARVR